MLGCEFKELKMFIAIFSVVVSYLNFLLYFKISIPCVFRNIAETKALLFNNNNQNYIKEWNVSK